MYGETVWRRAERVKQLINNLDRGKYNLAMGYHLKFILNAENGGTSTQSEAFFPFQHAFHEKICLSKRLTLTETICCKIWAQSVPKNAKKVHFWLTYFTQKSLCLLSSQGLYLFFITSEL